MRPGLTAGALGPSIVSLNANKSPPAPPPAAHVTRAVTSPGRASPSVSVVTNTVLGAYRTSGLPLSSSSAGLLAESSKPRATGTPLMAAPALDHTHTYTCRACIMLILWRAFAGS